MKRSLVVAAIGAALLFTATHAVAQSPVSFGLGGGITLPTGDTKKAFDESGYHVQGMLGFGLPMLPVGLRMDLGYHAFNGQVREGAFTTKVDQRLFIGNLNGIVKVPGMVVAAPYLIGGIGLYNNGGDISAGELGREKIKAETDFGLNIGGGIKFNLAGFSTFLEARYHYIMDKDKNDPDSFNSTYIPITFGIMF